MHALVYPAILTRLVYRSLQSYNEKYNIIEAFITLHNRNTHTYSSLPLKETSSQEEKAEVNGLCQNLKAD